MGPKCQRCAHLVQNGFALMSWDLVVAQASANAEFGALIKEALSAQDGGPKTFSTESFAQANYHGYRVEQAYTLFTAADLEKLSPGTTFKELSAHITIHSILDERGVKQEGILVAESSPPRIIAYRDWNTQYSELVHNPASQLRRQQGLDICQWYRKDLEKIVPSAMIAKRPAVSLDSIKEAIAKATAVKQVAVEQAQLLQPPPPTAVAAPAAEQEEEAKEPELDIVYTVDESQPVLTAPSESTGHGRGGNKAKPKGKKGVKNRDQEALRGSGRGRGQASVRGRGRATSMASGSNAGSRDGKSDAGTVGGQSQSGGKKDPKTPDGLFQQWYEALPLERLLQGEGMALSIHHATRALGGIKSQHGEAHVAYVLLKGHLDLVNAAQRLLPAHIGATKAPERASILRDLQIANVSIPVYCAASLLARSAQEETCLKKKLAMLNPSPAPPSSSGEMFDPFNPTLQGAALLGLSDTEQGKMIQRGLVTDCLVPMVCPGERSRDSVEQLCGLIVSEWGSLPEKTSLMVTYAVEELLLIAEFLLVLLSTTSTDSDAAKLAKLLESGQGSKVIVKQARWWG